MRHKKVHSLNADAERVRNENLPNTPYIFTRNSVGTAECVLLRSDIALWNVVAGLDGENQL